MNKQCDTSRVSLNLDGLIFAAGDKYVYNPFGKDNPGIKDVICLMCGCGPTSLKYFTLEGKIMNIRNPGNCCCPKPWHVETGMRGQDKTRVATARKRKVNCFSSADGFAFSNCGCLLCLPWCQCSGHMKHLSIEDKVGKEKYTLLQELVRCWPCSFFTAGACASIGSTIAGITACNNFCKGRVIRATMQPVYGPLPTRDAVPVQVASVLQQHFMLPVSCCIALPYTPIRYVFTTADGRDLDEEELAEASLLLAMFKGLRIPDCVAKLRPPFPQPMGICCTDVGLKSAVRFLDVKEAMKNGTFDV